MRRYYVTVHGGGDGVLLPANSGEILRQQAMANLRRIRIDTGFDYAGMEIQGTSVNGVPDLSIARVGDVIPAGSVSDTRIIVSERPVADAATENYGLVVTISRGDAFSWGNGLATIAADIRVSREEASEQLSAVVLDIFQELMLANCASIQAVLAKFIASGGTQDDFFRAKAEYAADMIARGEADTMFEHFAADRYACFATLARGDLYPVLDADDRARFGAWWSGFLLARFIDHFLTVDEAVALVRSGQFHKARPELVAGGGGVRPGARVRHGSIDEGELRRVIGEPTKAELRALNGESPPPEALEPGESNEEELRELLGDPQRVRQAGAYILCILTSNPKEGDAGKVGAMFGWRRSATKSPKRLRLCTEDTYKEMVPLVRKGLVTPVRLFLKANR